MQGATAAPLIERSIQRATGIVYTVTGGADVTLGDLAAVSDVIGELASPDCNIIFGTVTDAAFDGQLHVTVIATGFADDFGAELATGGNGAAAVGGSSAGGVGPLPVVPHNARGNPFDRNRALGLF